MKEGTGWTGRTAISTSHIPFGKSKTTKLLKDMGEKGVIAIEGKGRGTKYIIK